MKQKKSTDDDLVRRAKKFVEQGHTEFQAILDWDARGREPKENKSPYRRSIRKLINTLQKQGHTKKKIAEIAGVTIDVIHQLHFKGFKKPDSKTTRKIYYKLKKCMDQKGSK